MSSTNLARLKKVLAVAICALSGHAMALELDPDFGTDGLAAIAGLEFGHGVALAPGGKVVIAGIDPVPAPGTGFQVTISRLNSDGSIDTTLNADGNADGSVAFPACAAATDIGNAGGYLNGKNVAVQSDGSIVVVNSCGDNVTPGTSVITRLTVSGAPDPSFGTNGVVVLDDGPLNLGFEATTVAVRVDDSIIIGGNYAPLATQKTGVIMALTGTGTADNTFGTNGVTTLATGSEVSAVRIRVDGGVYVVGSIADPARDALIVRLQSNGLPDTNFNGTGVLRLSVGRLAAPADPGALSADYFYDLAIRSDGSLLVSGAALSDEPGSVFVPFAAQIRSTGVLDTLWGANGFYIPARSVPTDSAHAYAIALRSDGTSVIAGDNVIPSQIGLDGTPHSSLDQYFEIWSLTVQSDGRIVGVVEIPSNGAESLLGVRFLPGDVSPDALTFTSLTNQLLEDEVVSEELTISGINTSVSVSISNGEFSIGCDGTFNDGSTPATVEDGDTICLRHVTSELSTSSVVTVLTVGDAESVFQSTTGDATPSTFPLTDVYNAEIGETVYSNIVTIRGITIPVLLTVLGGEYSLGCDGTFSSEPTLIENNATFCVRHVAGDEVDTQIITTVTVGTATDYFFSRTVLTASGPGGGGGGGVVGTPGDPQAGGGWNGGVQSEGGWDWGKGKPSGGGGGGSFDGLLLLGLISSCGVMLNRRRKVRPEQLA